MTYGDILTIIPPIRIMLLANFAVADTTPAAVTGREAGLLKAATREQAMSFDRNYKDSRILVTGGAGFIGSHLCERLLAEGAEVLCVDNYFTGSRRNIAHLLANPMFEADAARRDVSALRRGRRDLQPGLPGLADPLPARSGADHQDQRAWRDQHAGPRQAAAGARSSRPRPARSMAIPLSTRRPRTTGATSIRSASARATTKASAAPRPCFSTIAASTRCRSRSRASSTPTARACIRTTAGWCRYFIVQALQGRADHRLRRRRADPLVLLCRRPRRGFIRLMATDDDMHRPDQPRQQLGEFTILRTGREGDQLTGSRSKLDFQAAAARTIRGSASRTSPRRRRCWTGSRTSRSTRASSETIAYFRRSLELS